MGVNTEIIRPKSKLSAYLKYADIDFKKVILAYKDSPVVANLEKLSIPPNIIWEYFSSDPGATGGKIIFPYLRIDALLNTTKNCLYRLSSLTFDDNKKADNYAMLSLAAFKTILWVEIGFKGLYNYASSPASVNWSATEVADDPNPISRRDKILQTSPKYYYARLLAFAKFRVENFGKEKWCIEDDFKRFNLEYLLNDFPIYHYRSENN